MQDSPQNMVDSPLSSGGISSSLGTKRGMCSTTYWTPSLDSQTLCRIYSDSSAHRNNLDGRFMWQTVTIIQRAPVLFRCNLFPILLSSAGWGYTLVVLNTGWFLTIYAWELLLKMLSGTMILLTITWKLRMILQNIWRRVFGHVLINISPPNIFPNMFLSEIFHTELSGCFWLLLALIDNHHAKPIHACSV